MEADEAVEVLKKNYPKCCKKVDGRYQGGFDDFESELGQAITTAISALEIVQKIPVVIKQLEGYKCATKDGKADYYIAIRNTHYNDAIILVKELLN